MYNNAYNTMFIKKNAKEYLKPVLFTFAFLLLNGGNVDPQSFLDKINSPDDIKKISSSLTVPAHA